MKMTVLGVVAAAALFPWVFRVDRGSFWTRMPLVTGALGMLALATKPELREETPDALDVVTGVLSAAGLYGIFQVGDRFARRFMPTGVADVKQIYDLRQGAPRWLMTMLLVGIIAPCEELFWRGLVFDSLAKKYGPVRGGALASVCYGAAHLGSGNLTLSGAAGIGGAYWGLQYAVQKRLPAVIVSHIVFDVWTFLVAPTPGGKSPPEPPASR